jgi:hypothetical protein
MPSAVTVCRSICPVACSPCFCWNAINAFRRARAHDSVGKADVEAFLFQDHLRLPNLLRAEMHCVTGRADTGLLVLQRRVLRRLVLLRLVLLRLVLLSLVLLRLVRLRLPLLQSGTVALGRARAWNIGPILLDGFGLLDFSHLSLVVLVLRLRAALVPLHLALAAVGLVLFVSSVPILGFLLMLPLFALLLVCCARSLASRLIRMLLRLLLRLRGVVVLSL